MSVRDEILDLKNRISAEIVGQERIVESLLIGLLCNGNLLVEGLPGLAKTRAIKALSNNIEGSFNRIQFTPDIVSADITGRQVYYKAENEGQGIFKFEPGPIFANIVLGDEVNRAPAKSQNALLEAMEERQVTVAAVSHKMPDLFMVMATMNPAGQEGTFPMPEAQMDRFLMHVTVSYPDEQAEMEIIRLIRKEQSQKTRQENAKRAEKAEKGEKPGKGERVRTPQKTIFAARAEIDQIQVPEDVERYMVDLIFATRYPQRYTYELKSFIRVGASPRASIALDKCARAHTWMQGRDTVTMEDVQGVLKGVLRHRLIRGERAIEHKITTDDIVEDLIELVPIPGRAAQTKSRALAAKEAAARETAAKQAAGEDAPDGPVARHAAAENS